jgi:hypothetical protein
MRALDSFQPEQATMNLAGFSRNHGLMRLDIPLLFLVGNANLVKRDGLRKFHREMKCAGLPIARRG